MYFDEPSRSKSQQKDLSQPDASARDCDFTFDRLFPQDPSLTLFEVAFFATAVDLAWENSGNHHNPKRQRGIFANTAEAKERYPSLTRRVGI